MSNLLSTVSLLVLFISIFFFLISESKRSHAIGSIFLLAFVISMSLVAITDILNYHNTVDNYSLHKLVNKTESEIKDFAKSNNSKLYEMILDRGYSNKDIVIDYIEKESLNYINSQEFNNSPTKIGEAVLNSLFIIKGSNNRVTLYDRGKLREIVLSLVTINNNSIKLSELYKEGNINSIKEYFSTTSYPMYEIIKDKEEQEVLRFVKLYILDDAKDYINSDRFINDTDNYVSVKLDDFVKLAEISELDYAVLRQELRLSLLDIIEKERKK